MMKTLMWGLLFILFLGCPVYAADTTEQRLSRIELRLEKMDKIEAIVNENRERLIKLEEGQKAINQRMDDMGKRIDDVRDLIYVVLAGMFALVGFVIWDRRTALAPAIRKNKELEEREERLERVIKEFAEKEPRLLEALRHAGFV
ncbi:MAG: hypothetical protein HY786_02690 [Deltaproteobacteria bacterium]|nr:hypothetical protein [Deltaproteobacteria bacterium]